MYRLTFLNDNGWAVSHIDYRADDPLKAAELSHTLSAALHPIGSAGLHRWAELTPEDIERENTPQPDRVAATCLHPGDVLVPTNRRVIFAGQTIDTPRGKTTVELVRERRDGTQKIETRHFNSRTMITVLRRKHR